MAEPFIGSEAVASRVLVKSALRTQYTKLFRVASRRLCQSGHRTNATASRARRMVVVGSPRHHCGIVSVRTPRRKVGRRHRAAGNYPRQQKPAARHTGPRWWHWWGRGPRDRRRPGDNALSDCARPRMLVSQKRSGGSDRRPCSCHRP